MEKMKPQFPKWDELYTQPSTMAAGLARLQTRGTWREQLCRRLDRWPALPAGLGRPFMMHLRLAAVTVPCSNGCNSGPMRSSSVASLLLQWLTPTAVRPWLPAPRRLVEACREEGEDAAVALLPYLADVLLVGC
jgi:hypothetical protein